MEIKEKLYVIGEKLFELEALATNMASGEDFYFLRNTEDNSDITRIPIAELPKPYQKQDVTIPPDALYIENGTVKLSGCEKTIDVGFGNRHVYKTKTGDFVHTQKFYNVNGALVYVDSEGRIMDVPNSPNSFTSDFTGLWCELSQPVSLLTGRIVEGDLKIRVGSDIVPVNKDEVIFSSLSYDMVIKDSQDYVVTAEGNITRQDIINGLTDEWLICEDCGRIHHIDDNEYLDYYDKNVCRYCLDNYRWSTYDNNYFSTDDCVFVESIDDYVSYSSLNANFRRCDHCGEYYREDDVNVTDNDYNICIHCYEDDDVVDEDNYYIQCDDNFIHSYSYKPSPLFFGGDDKVKYFGLEYEVQGGGCDNYTARKIFGKFSHWYCKHDGSLEDGFEAVTHPCTPEFMLQNIDWETLVDKLDDEGYCEEEGAGIHIHISRNHFKSRSHIGKLVRFFAENYDRLVKYANRYRSDATQWANKTDVEGCDTFEKCYSEARCERYSAVNVQNEHTIEIRLWNSSYNAKVIRSFIQMTDVLTDLANGLWEDFTWENIEKLAEERGYQEMLDRI